MFKGDVFQNTETWEVTREKAGRGGHRKIQEPGHETVGYHYPGPGLRRLRREHGEASGLLPEDGDNGDCLKLEDSGSKSGKEVSTQSSRNKKPERGTG
jgi:hypothetical protein